MDRPLPTRFVTTAGPRSRCPHHLRVLRNQGAFRRLQVEIGVLGWFRLKERRAEDIREPEVAPHTAILVGY